MLSCTGHDLPVPPTGTNEQTYCRASLHISTSKPNLFKTLTAHLTARARLSPKRDGDSQRCPPSRSSVCRSVRHAFAGGNMPLDIGFGRMQGSSTRHSGSTPLPLPLCKCRHTHTSGMNRTKPPLHCEVAMVALKNAPHFHSLPFGLPNVTARLM